MLQKAACLKQKKNNNNNNNKDVNKIYQKKENTLRSSAISSAKRSLPRSAPGDPDFGSPRDNPRPLAVKQHFRFWKTKRLSSWRRPSEMGHCAKKGGEDGGQTHGAAVRVCGGTTAIKKQ